MVSRVELEADPYSDATQAIYDVCREARLHTWDRNNPNGGGRLLVHERGYRKKIIKVRRELTCDICTTRRVSIYWYVAEGEFERYAQDGINRYDWPEGYRMSPLLHGDATWTRIDFRTASFDRLPVVDAGKAVTE